MLKKDGWRGRERREEVGVKKKKKRGRQRERGGERRKGGREKNKGVFTCLWNQQLAALSHNLRHMDVIRTTMSVCVCVCVCVCKSLGVCVCVCV